MTLSALANIADLLGALGIIASVTFVAFEIRKSSEQARMSNWNAVLSALREHKRRTDDPYVADLVVRGRNDFEALTEAEKLTFGFWMEELVQCYDGLIVHENAIAVDPVESRRAAVGAFALHFSFPGCLAWYRWSGIEHRWPRQLIEAIEEGITQSKSD